MELLTSLNEILMSVPPLSTDRTFYPFTQPILYGKVEYFIKHGSNDDQHHVDGHERLSSDLLVNI